MRETRAWDVLDAFVTKHGSQVKAARELGISQPYLCDLLSQKKDLNKARIVLKKLGLRQVTVKE